jgi:hypothetical protein
MAAGLGFKDFVTGEVLTAADVDGYLMQGVWVFANAAARDAAVTSPQEGNFAYLKDTNVTTYYTGSAWANLDTTGMTNPMTTTGDTIYSSSGSTPARLGIGSTGQVLTVAGGVPSWATPAGGATFSGVSLYKSANQSIANTTEVAITWVDENFDTDSYHSNSTNTDRITIPSGKDGYFLITAQATFGQNATGIRAATLKKNGTVVIEYIINNQGASAYPVMVFNKTVAAVATDYFQLFMYQDSGGSLNAISGNGNSFFNMTYLGA